MEAEANLALSDIAINGLNQAAAEEMPKPSELEKLTKQQLYALAQEKDIPKRLGDDQEPVGSSPDLIFRQESV